MPFVPAKLTQMGPADDPEVLITFKRDAAVAQWSLESWAIMLAPYMVTHQGLNMATAQNDAQVKAPILDVLNISPETYQEQFCSKKFLLGAWSWAVTQRLKEYCWWWHQPEGRMGIQVIEKVILEQFT